MFGLSIQQGLVDLDRGLKVTPIDFSNPNLSRKIYEAIGVGSGATTEKDWSYLKLPGIVPITIDKMVQFLCYLEQQCEQGIVCPLLIWYQGRLVGTTSFKGLENGLPMNRKIEIGTTILGIPFRGKGLNRPVKHLMMTHSFSFGVDVVVFKVREDNIASIRSLENSFRVTPFRITEDGVNKLIYEIDKNAFDL
ncbi:GNAT family N-acetyltransferase [Shimazuella kribbensis]|uniref:GNAT family N-acetyltransferase n=1 Tax=Shimazuella kribbensis TaxID=139808 RepID=UPI000413EADC|nr:GNAT family protein [Shimazuella kribbensis]